MARLGARTGAVLGVDGLAAGAAELDVIRDTGASLHMVDLEHGPVFENIEQPGGRVQICVATSSRVPAAAVPPAWAAAPVWILAPVADEIGDEWAAVPPVDAVVAVAWQGMLRDLLAGERVRRRVPRASALVARADIVAASHHDIAPGTEVDELLAMLRPGAHFLLTKGAEGGILWRRGSGGRVTARRYPALIPDGVVDATGAGDTFLAALVSTWLVPELARLRDRGGDLRFAAAAGSLVVEGYGLAGVPDLGAVVRRTRRSIGYPAAG
ncbi:MAG TPA: PfkB family carbohydrate kinase [Candidatus Limnocylindrales bacterium]|nr:PfkB family carbohydrate kinase [Candidatus Limnocylindrales bacterium]